VWYRLYELDQGDHILKAASLEFPGDAEAMAAAAAQGLLCIHSLELWQAARCVGRVPARILAPKEL
jgi:hypothetical protein